jgi:hypothetical protein
MPWQRRVWWFRPQRNSGKAMIYGEADQWLFPNQPEPD